MARPKSDHPPKTPAERYAKSEQTLRTQGGRRLNVRLSADAAEALDQLTQSQGLSQTAATEAALIQAATKRRPNDRPQD